MKYMILMGDDWTDTPQHVGEGMTLAEAVGDLMKEVDEHGDGIAREHITESFRTLLQALDEQEEMN